MNTEDLYKEEQCPQCGQMKLKTASFCPHCGYVKKTGFAEKLGELFGRGGREASQGVTPHGASISTVLGLLFAGYLVYSAIERSSVQSLIMALLVLFATLQSWYAARKRAERHAKEPEDRHEGDSERASPLEDKFFCENCGTQVAAEATQCPKCGMKFG